MHICVLLGSDTEFAKQPNESLVKSNMNPEQDAFEIWAKAGSAGYDKYIKGSAEHKTQFWTAGAKFYADNLQEEQLDLISYLHHLRVRLDQIQVLSTMMEEEEISLKDASIILKKLVSSNPPSLMPPRKHD